MHLLVHLPRHQRPVRMLCARKLPPNRHQCLRLLLRRSPIRELQERQPFRQRSLARSETSGVFLVCLRLHGIPATAFPLHPLVQSRSYLDGRRASGNRQPVVRRGTHSRKTKRWTILLSGGLRLTFLVHRQNQVPVLPLRQPLLLLRDCAVLHRAVLEHSVGPLHQDRAGLKAHQYPEYLCPSA